MDLIGQPQLQALARFAKADIKQALLKGIRSALQ
jgi:hypothetical protein